jgi:hypothetical protein
MRALAIAIWPTPPQPQTATVSPGSMPARSAPKKPVGTASETNRACSSVIPSGTLKAPVSANGTRTYSAWLPA